MLREAVGVVATSVALAPAVVAAQLADAMSTRTLPLEALGITERPLAIERLGGGRSAAVYRVQLRDRTIVVKHALAGGSVLAFAALVAGPQHYPSDLSPSARIRREADALAVLAAAGVRAPRVIAANPAAHLIAIDYLAGESLAHALTKPALHGAGLLARFATQTLVAQYARVLDAAHAAGLVLNDAHPGNALVTADGIALIDLEFAEHSHDPAHHAFDVAYAAQFLTPSERSVFLRGKHVDAQLAELAGYAPLFAYEQIRQRTA